MCSVFVCVGGTFVDVLFCFCFQWKIWMEKRMMMMMMVRVGETALVFKNNFFLTLSIISRKFQKAAFLIF